MDSALIPLSIPGLNLIQTTDFFYPLVDDPYMQGKIAAANVLSDLYAMGTTKCDNLLMLLGVPKTFTEKQRDVVVPLVIKGFKDAADEAGSQVTGGQTVVNPWFLVGGVATAVCHKEEFVMPDMAQAGDVLVLTKPLGTQIAVNAHQWLEEPDRWQKINDVITPEEVECAYQEAMFNMAFLNKHAASLMKKFNAHAATDVTGFGILGHAKNLAQHQSQKLKFVIHTLPIIAKMTDTAKACGIKLQLLQGYSSETSGGLLIAMPKEDADGFLKEFEQISGNSAWIIGSVENTSDPDATIADNPNIIEVKTKIT